MVQPNGRDTPRPFCLARIDAILGSAESSEVKRIADSFEVPSLERFTLAGGMEVLQESFCWEALTLAFSAPEFEIEVVRDWWIRWLDPEVTRQPDVWGLSAVVHDLAWTHNDKQDWQLRLDFGSAPLAALEELLTLLSAAGAKQVAVSRHDLDPA